jgi:hypothetical protein
MNRRGKLAAARVIKKQEIVDARPVSELFPGVTGIIISMVYSKTGVLEPLTREVNFHPGSNAIFKVSCLCPECTEDYFEFTKIIKAMIKARKTVSHGKISCDTCPAPESSNVSYTVSIKYAHRR